MISQPTTDTSVVANVVAFASVTELITKDTPAVLVPVVRFPTAAAPVAPIDSLHTRTRELAVKAVVLIVSVPPMRVAVPIELAPAAAPEPTLVRTILFPAAVRTKFPLVAVRLPVVAVSPVPAVIAPVEATVVPVTAAGVPEPRAGGEAKFTFKVMVPAVPAVESIPVPAARVILPAIGVIAPPLDPVTVSILPTAPEPKLIQTPEEPEYIKAAGLAVFSQRVPFTYALSVVAGFLNAVCKSGGRSALTPRY